MDGRAVSVVQIFDRPIRIGTCPVRMAGLGSVGTDPDHRRQGYGLGVLRDTVRYARAAGFDLSMLGTGVPSHYFRAGWVPHPTHALRIELPDAVPEPDADVDIVRCELERDLPILRRIYDTYNAGRTGTLVRDRGYWLAQPKWRTQDPELFRMARREAAGAAYLKAGRWDILELAHAPGEERAGRALLAWFLARARAEGVAELQALLPGSCAPMFEALGCGVRRREHTGWMVRLLDLNALLGKMAGMLGDRLRVSGWGGWQGTVRLAYEAGAVGLRVSGDGVTVTAGSGPCDACLSMSHDQLLRLLLGNVRADDIAFANGLEVRDAVFRLLDTVFPRDELMLWRPDGF